MTAILIKCLFGVVVRNFNFVKGYKFMSKMRFFFVRDEKRFPVACVAYQEAVQSDPFDTSEKVNVIHYAFSVHNPADLYDRKRARHIAEQRFLKGKYATLAVGADKLSFNFIPIAVKVDMLQFAEISTRLRKIMKNEIEDLYER